MKVNDFSKSELKNEPVSKLRERSSQLVSSTGNFIALTRELRELRRQHRRLCNTFQKRLSRIHKQKHPSGLTVYYQTEIEHLLNLSKSIDEISRERKSLTFWQAA